MRLKVTGKGPAGLAWIAPSLTLISFSGWI